MEQAMLSLIGFNFPTLVVLSFCLFSATLGYIAMLDNWQARQAEKETATAGRAVRASTEASPR
jgi:hypothetical protein